VKSLARWAFRNKFIVFATWIAAFAGLTVSANMVGAQYGDSFSLPGVDSTKALSLLGEAFPRQSGDNESVVFRVKTGTVNDPSVKFAMERAFVAIASIPSVGTVKSPYDPQNSRQISDDHQTAYASVVFEKEARSIPVDDVRLLIALGSKERTNNLQIEFGGQAIGDLNRPKGSVGTMIGVAAAAIILFISFGSFLAMLLPIGVALLALGTATAGVTLLTHVISIASFAPMLGSLIGLGVGIDYALFIVSRYRREISNGAEPEDAAITALDTSGRAVIFAGATVCIALLGLLVLRLSFLDGVAVAASLTVLVTMIAAITLLPALFGLIKRHVFSRRSRTKIDAGSINDHSQSYWGRWATAVARKPIPLSLAAVAVMAVLVIPYFSLQLGSSDQGNNPPSSTTHKAYDLLAHGFGAGTNGPLLVIAQLKTPADRQALAEVATALRSEAEVAAISPVTINPSQTIGFIQVIPTTGPQDIKTSNLIKDLRNRLIPNAIGEANTKIYVGGATAIFDDFASVIAGKLPLFIGVIVFLGCLLLLLAFRSFAIPLTAAVMNLAAAGASFGVVVALFQWGWGEKILNIGRGPIESFLPVIMLAILFGLSMDYQVFLVSRMHEEWINTKDNSRAVITGQSDTGRIITSAALIMILVFSSFVFGGEKVIKEFGVGLAGAVFIDAFILRTILVPALMHLFGKANWWIPKSVDRYLPHLSVDQTEDVIHQG